MSTTRYVMRILDDANYWSEEFDPAHPHLERWVVELDCDKGITTTADPTEAKTFSSREKVREYWLRECETGKPWDYFESGIELVGPSMPLAQYMVMIETLNEAVKHFELSPQTRWEVRINGNR